MAMEGKDKQLRRGRRCGGGDRTSCCGGGRWRMTRAADDGGVTTFGWDTRLLDPDFASLARLKLGFFAIFSPIPGTHFVHRVCWCRICSSTRIFGSGGERWSSVG
nr:hypothetical protein Iba_scaffold11838CG0020 [Ipomoea batatas]GME12177.1 hypothetical protein Iba_scaffold13490CG0010 [Ipomoea batatas]